MTFSIGLILLIFFGLFIGIFGLGAIAERRSNFTMQHIKKIYLYAVSLISLIIMVVAAIMLVNLALKAWVFPKADDAFYYAPMRYCTEVKNPDGTTVPQDPSCADPNYEQKERDAEKERRKAQKQQDAAQAIAMLVVSAPVFLYHWNLARKEQ